MRRPAEPRRSVNLTACFFCFVSFGFRAGLKPTEVTAKMGQMWAECSDAQKEVGVATNRTAAVLVSRCILVLMRKGHGLHGLAAKVEWRPSAPNGIPCVANSFPRRPTRFAGKPHLRYVFPLCHCLLQGSRLLLLHETRATVGANKSETSAISTLCASEQIEFRRRPGN